MRIISRLFRLVAVRMQRVGNLLQITQKPTQHSLFIVLVPFIWPVAPEGLAVFHDCGVVQAFNSVYPGQVSLELQGDCVRAPCAKNRSRFHISDGNVYIFGMLGKFDEDKLQFIAGLSRGFFHPFFKI